MTGATLSIPYCAVACGSYRGAKLYKFHHSFLGISQFYYSLCDVVSIGSTLRQTMFFIDLTLGGV